MSMFQQNGSQPKANPSPGSGQRPVRPFIEEGECIDADYDRLHAHKVPLYEPPTEQLERVTRERDALLKAAIFSRSVHSGGGLWDLPEKMAIEKLTAAISLPVRGRTTMNSLGDHPLYDMPTIEESSGSIKNWDRPSFLERLWRWARLLLGSVALFAAFVLIILFGLFVTKTG